MGWFKTTKEDKKEEILPSLPKISEDSFSRLKKELPESPPEISNLEINELPEIPEFDSSYDKKKFTKELDFNENKFSSPSMMDSPYLNKKSLDEDKSKNINIEKPSYQFKKSVEEDNPFSKVEIIPEAVEVPSSIPTKSLINSSLEEKSITGGYYKPVTKKIEPVYIRLDKFETTVQSLYEIKNKINEIQEILLKIKEVREREEKEIEEWEKEIQIIKSKIDFIDKNVFGEIE